MPAQISINGQTFSGNSIEVKDGQIYIDRQKIKTKDTFITIDVVGDVERLKADVCESIKINGNVNGDVKTQVGDIECGNVGGNVKTETGDIHLQHATGDVKTQVGDIKYKSGRTSSNNRVIRTNRPASNNSSNWWDNFVEWVKDNVDELLEWWDS